MIIRFDAVENPRHNHWLQSSVNDKFRPIKNIVETGRCLTVKEIGSEKGINVGSVHGILGVCPTSPYSVTEKCLYRDLSNV